MTPLPAKPERAKRESRSSTKPRPPKRQPASAAEDQRTPAAWLVLALLIEQPSHGYELKQRYGRRFGSFLPMSFPRLYGALDRLRDAGMIEPIPAQPDRPEGRQHLMRRSYRATDAGVEAYHSWVAERMSDAPTRLELLGRVTSAGLLGIDAVLDVVDRYQRECMEQLRALPTGSDALDAGESDLEQLTESLLADQQRRELRARNDWALYARAVLEAHKQTAAASAEEPEASKRATGRRLKKAS